MANIKQRLRRAVEFVIIIIIKNNKKIIIFVSRSKNYYYFEKFLQQQQQLYRLPTPPRIETFLVLDSGREN